jgi:hypothetical protein
LYSIVQVLLLDHLKLSGVGSIKAVTEGVAEDYVAAGHGGRGGVPGIIAGG